MPAGAQQRGPPRGVNYAAGHGKNHHAFHSFYHLTICHESLLGVLQIPALQPTLRQVDSSVNELRLSLVHETKIPIVIEPIGYEPRARRFSSYHFRIGGHLVHAEFTAESPPVDLALRFT